MSFVYRLLSVLVGAVFVVTVSLAGAPSAEAATCTTFSPAPRPRAGIGLYVKVTSDCTKLKRQVIQLWLEKKTVDRLWPLADTWVSVWYSGPIATSNPRVFKDAVVVRPRNSTSNKWRTRIRGVYDYGKQVKTAASIETRAYFM